MSPRRSRMSHPPSIPPDRAGGSGRFARLRPSAGARCRSRNPTQEVCHRIWTDLGNPPARVHLGAYIGSHTRHHEITRDESNLQPGSALVSDGVVLPSGIVSYRLESARSATARVSLSISRMTARSSAGVFAAAARGLSSVRMRPPNRGRSSSCRNACRERFSTPRRTYRPAARFAPTPAPREQPRRPRRGRGIASLDEGLDLRWRVERRGRHVVPFQCGEFQNLFDPHLALLHHRWHEQASKFLVVGEGLRRGDGSHRGLACPRRSGLETGRDIVELDVLAALLPGQADLVAGRPSKVVFSTVFIDAYRPGSCRSL